MPSQMALIDAFEETKRHDGHGTTEDHRGRVGREDGDDGIDRSTLAEVVMTI